MGDWNASIGKGRVDRVVGDHGLGTRNERGERLIEFCKERKLVIANTWFKHHKRKLYTWKSPGDRYRKQIDFILIEERYRNGIKNACGLPGADINSDHVLLLAELEIKLKRIKIAKRVKNWDLDKLKNMDREDIGREMGNEMKKEIALNSQETNIEDRWRRIKNAMIKVAEKEVGYRRGKRAKKPWITSEMIEKMEERRKYKRQNTSEGKRAYRRLNNELRNETKRAREKWLLNECKEIEELNRLGRHDIVYNKVRNMEWDRGKTQSKIASGIESEDGKLLTEENQVLKRWKEYMEKLYRAKEKPEQIKIENESEVSEEGKGGNVLLTEIKAALKDMKNGKAAGIDGIPVELIKCLEEDTEEEGMRILRDLCNEIYESGVWPEDFVRTVMIPLQKKKGTRKCEEHRTISVIAHVAKILLRVIDRRLRRIMEEVVGEDQFGFRRGMGTRDAIAVVKTIGERYIERGRAVRLCLVDLEKAFDCVKYEKLLEILKDKGVDWRERRLISNLYMKQEVALRVGDNMTEWFKIGRGVRQGCCLSPTLFNIYMEDMVRKCWERNKGVKIGGRSVKSVRFADDMIIFAENTQELNEMLKSLEEMEDLYGLRINHRKSKLMIIGEEEVMDVVVRGEKLEQVEANKYLGTEISVDWRSEKEIRLRIGMAKQAYLRRRMVFNSKMDIELRKRLVKCLVWSVLLYGCEVWTLNKREVERLEAFEMWTWRRLLKVKWSDKIKNDEVLRRAGEERQLLNNIRKRKRNWVGHVLRGNGILRDVLEGSVEERGGRKRGRRKRKWIDDLKKGNGYVGMKREAMDRELWKRDVT